MLLTPVARSEYNLFFLTDPVKYKMALIDEGIWRSLMTRKGPEGFSPGETGGTRSRPPLRVQLADLPEGGREAIVVHDGEGYRLRVAADCKLDLTN
jgi:hemin uptake protein HemP